MIEEVTTGKYRHYKGNEYEVLSIGTHTETGEKLVVYKALYGANEVWLRPLEMFKELVTIDNKTIPRFAKVTDE